MRNLFIMIAVAIALKLLTACGGEPTIIIHQPDVVVNVPPAESPTVIVQAPTLSCNTGWTLCDGACVDTKHNDNHCGQCGMRCQGGTSCQGLGFCGCKKGQTLCDGECRDTTWDPDNCGECSKQCNGDQVCYVGMCTDHCGDDANPNYVLCAGNLCTNIGSDPNNCGSCNWHCSGNHIVTRECVLQQCDGECVTGFLDCNRFKRHDGCEVDAMNDPDNCGGCGIKCIFPQSCSRGICTSP